MLLWFCFDTRWFHFVVYNLVLLWFHFELTLISCWFCFGFTWFHIDYALVSLCFHFDLTLVSLLISREKGKALPKKGNWKASTGQWEKGKPGGSCFGCIPTLQPQHAHAWWKWKDFLVMEGRPWQPSLHPNSDFAAASAGSTSRRLKHACHAEGLSSRRPALERWTQTACHVLMWDKTSQHHLLYLQPYY